MTLASLIPSSLFASQETWLLVVILVAGLLALLKGGDALVEAAAALALKLGIPKVIVGATIVSLGTTSAETAVSVMAAFQGNAALALGNAVGSIICDTGLIFGLSCMITVLPADRYVLNRHGWIQLATGLGLALYCWTLFALDGYQATLPRTAGVVLLALLAVYLYFSARWGKTHPAHLAETIPLRAEDDAAPGHSVFRLLGIGGLGLVGVLAGAELTIGSVGIIAGRVGIPNAVIAGTLVAFGTSLPELMVAITSIRKKHLDLLIGNVLGADILNGLFVTGAAALAAPLPITELGSKNPLALVQLGLPAMVLILVAFRGMAFLSLRRGHFSRWMGLPLFLVYLAYLLACYLWQPVGTAH